MKSFLVWVVPIAMLFIGHKATISRSAHAEMHQFKEAKHISPKVNLDEYWPFSETLSEVDPFVYELEIQLSNTAFDS